MNEGNFSLAATLISSNYAAQARDSRRGFERRLAHLLSQRQLPENGWSEVELRLLLAELALMDSNNFAHSVGVGEREGRVQCELVRQRHFGLSHGVGRSGDVTAQQPKAAGSSLAAQLTTGLCLDLLRWQGAPSAANSGILLPVATGMALMLCLLTLRQLRTEANYVVWTRIDQQSCIKAIRSAGLQLYVVEPILQGAELCTNLEGISKALNELGASRVVCVLTTTSCFAPRVPDRLVEVGRICRTMDVPHLVNNAYGVQASRCLNLIEEASRRPDSRLDLFVQSTDKNFLVPVGGAFVAGPQSDLVNQVAKSYPGRGSLTPALDVLLTLLSLGRKGYQNLLSERTSCFDALKSGLTALAFRHGQRLLVGGNDGLSNRSSNTISLAMTLRGISGDRATQLGSQLFTKGCTGIRVVRLDTISEVAGMCFVGFGSHHSPIIHSTTEDGGEKQFCAYLTAAATIGMKLHEVEEFLKRLDKALTKVFS